GFNLKRGRMKSSGPLRHKVLAHLRLHPVWIAPHHPRFVATPHTPPVRLFTCASPYQYRPWRTTGAHSLVAQFRHTRSNCPPLVPEK
ncbi:MAG: hypothetical protein WHT82_13295, partial [Limisphaera sp.]